MTKRQEIITNLGAILAGLQVPASIAGPQVLGAAYEPWCKLRDQLELQGWVSKDDAVAALTTNLNDEGQRVCSSSSRGAD